MATLTFAVTGRAHSTCSTGASRSTVTARTSTVEWKAGHWLTMRGVRRRQTKPLWPRANKRCNPTLAGNDKDQVEDPHSIQFQPEFYIHT